MADARETALRVLLSLRHGAWSDGALAAAIEKDGLDARDAALCTGICYGVLQQRLYLDYCIAQFSSLKMNKIAPTVLEILRIAAYQIYFLDKVPASAAVNEAVRQCRTHANPKAAGFVNAVLRKIAESPRPEVKAEDALDALSVRYSHPRPLVGLLAKNVGAEQIEALLAANNAPTPLSIRLNTLKGTPEELICALRSEGLEVTQDEHLLTAASVPGSGRITRLQSFSRGLFTVQDKASQLCAAVVDPHPGEEVLDLCSAPGGKSFAMAALMENRGRIISCDLHAHKLPLIEEGAERLGVTILQTLCTDATKKQERFVGRFDRVLADVPCSGLGVIRKKPDIRYKDIAELPKLPQIQEQILENAAEYVKPGGVLVYSTCTILHRENRKLVERVLEKHPELSLESFGLPGIGETGGDITLLPHVHGTDGFYIAKIRKKG
ncbi:MAG: 16S rRNA (cytosine(967)-C(5))-methyltransferase RsmB [Ruminococcaceae bacterium]|nr:16S rRNA (cytosine(967)-C(5))-methyltransferase RsmB [Oscillospiraceae bacterium]